MKRIDERLKELGKSREWLVEKADVKLDDLADENPVFLQLIRLLQLLNLRLIIYGACENQVDSCLNNFQGPGRGS